jgi:hypothetical protein
MAYAHAHLKDRLHTILKDFLAWLYSGLKWLKGLNLLLYEKNFGAL